VEVLKLVVCGGWLFLIVGVLGGGGGGGDNWSNGVGGRILSVYFLGKYREAIEI